MTLSPREVIEAPAREWRRYPEYKDSGIEWLSEVPEHWEVKPLKYTVTACQNGLWGEEPTGGADDLVCVRVADFDRIVRRVVDTKLTLRAVPVNQRDGKLLKAGDLLLEKSGGGDRQPVGTVVLYDLAVSAICSNFVARMPVAGGYDPSFLLYLHAALYSGRINVRSIKQNTGIQNLDSNSYLDEKVGLPLYEEQQAISVFLDRETQKIDGLIAKRERLIGLLEEKRTALISRAVTKGVDPDVPMKDSGVEWLGEIPTHWEVKRLKYLVNEQADGIQMGPFGGMLKHLVFSDTGYKVYGQENTINNDFEAGSRWIIADQFEEMSAYAVVPGDLVLTRKGSIGKCRVVPSGVIPGIIDSDTIRVRTNEQKIRTPYLVRIMHEGRYLQEQILFVRRGAILSGLNTATIANLIVAVPPSEEQSGIMRFLDAETGKIDALIGKVRDHIDKLREYRTALISAAVTGKIDVREEVSDVSDPEGSR